jgi:hypothetical protein
MPKVSRADEAIDLLTIDLRCVVIRGAAEAVPLRVVCAVDVGAAVRDQVDAIECGLERQQIIVAVASSSAHAHRSAIDEHVVSAAAHHVEAPIGKCGAIDLVVSNGPVC